VNDVTGARTIQDVRSALDAVFDTPPLTTVPVPASFHTLWARLREQTMGGKLVRPRLVDLGFRAGAGARGRSAAEADRPASVVRLGAAFELLHAALIVHDDMIDRDEMRRGRPTLAEQYRREIVAIGAQDSEATHLGRSIAVIAGDVLLTEAFTLATTCDPDPAVALRVAPIVFRAATAAAAGELEDVVFSLHRHGGEHPDTEEILLMERLKTASYTFEAPLEAGALLAGAPPAHAAALAEAGAQLGMAYQVIDDVLGTVGDPARTGKANGADLREGKATLLTAHGRKDPAVRRALDDVARAEQDGAGLAELDAAVHAARHALVGAGSITYATAVAAELVRSARELLDPLPMGDAERDEFAATCHTLLTREA